MLMNAPIAAKTRHIEGHPILTDKRRIAAHEPLEGKAGAHPFSHVIEMLHNDRAAVSFISSLSRSIAPEMPNYILLAYDTQSSASLSLLARRISGISAQSQPHGKTASQAALRALCGPKLDADSLSLLVSAAVQSADIQASLCISTISDMAGKGALLGKGVAETVNKFIPKYKENEVYPFLLVLDAALSNPNLPKGSVTSAVLSDIQEAVSEFCRDLPETVIPIEALNMAGYLETMSFKMQKHAHLPSEPPAKSGEYAIRQMIRTMQGKV
jgi:hypothetical protein